MKAHFFDPNYPIFITGFPATLKLLCDRTKVHKDAAMWALSHCAQKSLATGLNSLTCAENRLALLAASVRIEQHRYRKLLRAFSEVIY